MNKSNSWICNHYLRIIKMIIPKVGACPVCIWDWRDDHLWCPGVDDVPLPLFMCIIPLTIAPRRWERKPDCGNRGQQVPFFSSLSLRSRGRKVRPATYAVQLDIWTPRWARHGKPDEPDDLVSGTAFDKVKRLPSGCGRTSRMFFQNQILLTYNIQIHVYVYEYVQEEFSVKR